MYVIEETLHETKKNVTVMRGCITLSFPFDVQKHRHTN